MEVFNRICIKDWSITAKNGDHFEIKRGKEYLTSDDTPRETCVVFSGYWVEVPLSHMAGKEPFPKIGAGSGD